MRSVMVGQALVGDGSEVAHIELMIGSKTGPVGRAFAWRLAHQTAGHNGLLALLTPNVPVKPSTVMFNKFAIKGAAQAALMFGPVQAAVAKGVVDSVAERVISKQAAEDLVVVVGVFIDWEARDKKKIFDFNYQATKQAIQRALAEQPSVEEILGQKEKAPHPFLAEPVAAPKPPAESPPTLPRIGIWDWLRKLWRG